jgi:hypothetical protein
LHLARVNGDPVREICDLIGKSRIRRRRLAQKNQCPLLESRIVVGTLDEQPCGAFGSVANFYRRPEWATIPGSAAGGTER